MSIEVICIPPGAPVVMSMPHFLGCDPEQLEAIRGLNPKLEEHSSFLDLEPVGRIWLFGCFCCCFINTVRILDFNYTP